MIEIRHASMGESAAVRHAYDSIYRGQGIDFGDAFYLWLLGLLSPHPGASLLDVSCGRGRLAHLARRMGLRAHGVDFSWDAVAAATTAYPETPYAVADAEALPFASGSFDYVSNVGSIEHYLHPERGASEVARLLRSGGQACILLPNAFGLFGNIKHVLLRGDVFDDGQPLQRYATRVAWQRLLADAGLVVQRVVPYGEVDMPRSWAEMLRLLRRPPRALRGILGLLVPLNLANHFVFICRRSEPA